MVTTQIRHKLFSSDRDFHCAKMIRDAKVIVSCFYCRVISEVTGRNFPFISAFVNRLSFNAPDDDVSGVRGRWWTLIVS